MARTYNRKDADLVGLGGVELPKDYKYIECPSKPFIITANSGRFELRFQPERTDVNIFDNSSGKDLDIDFDEMCGKLFSLEYGEGW